jgi:hypothetical protein
MTVAANEIHVHSLFSISTWLRRDPETTTELSFERRLHLIRALLVDVASQVVRRAAIPAIL